MYEGKSVAIAGFGTEGQAAYEYYRARGASRVVIFDESETPTLPIPSDAEAELGPGALDRLHGFDIVSRTPPLRPEKIPADNGQVTSVTNEFFARCPAPIIGVTGTKGKGTTTTLTAEILRAAGLTAHIVGNIGAPALAALPEIKASDQVVYELSSFQLWDANRSPHVAVVLMIEEDHLDVHRDTDEYLAAKANIAAFQIAQDVTIYHGTNPQSAQVAAGGQGAKKRFLTDEAAHIEDGQVMIAGQAICRVEEVGLVGAHNLENICAAVSAAWEVTQDVAAHRQAVTSFKGLEHRLELVRELEGVRYFNDSFSAAVPAAVAATKSFSEPKIMIYGGFDKGLSYGGLAEAVAAGGVKRALLIGQTAPKLAAAFEEAGFKDYERADGDMAAIVTRAHELAEAGDVVVLSPGTSSFDMFKDYKDRGQQFKAAVLAL